MGNALCTVFKSRYIKVYYHGLYGAGKTSIIYRMALGHMTQVCPTIVGNTVQTISHKGTDMVAWEIGLRCRSRVMLQNFLKEVEACVLVVDASDGGRVAEAVEDFCLMVTSQLPDPAIPVLVLATKQDIEGALSAECIRQELGRHDLGLKAVEVFPVSAVTSEGTEAAFDWLTAAIATRLAQRSILDPWKSLLASAATTVTNGVTALVKGERGKKEALLASLGAAKPAGETFA